MNKQNKCTTIILFATIFAVLSIVANNPQHGSALAIGTAGQTPDIKGSTIYQTHTMTLGNNIKNLIIEIPNEGHEDPTAPKELRVVKLYSRKQPKEAVAQLDAYCRSPEGKSSVKAALALADLYRMTDDFDNCEKAIARAEAIAPRELGVFVVRLRLAAARKQFDTMLAMMKERLEKDPSQPQALLSGMSLLAASENGNAYLPRTLPAPRRVHGEEPAKRGRAARTGDDRLPDGAI